MSDAPGAPPRSSASTASGVGGAPAPEAPQAGGWAGIGDVVVILGLALTAWILSGNFAGNELMLVYGIAPAAVPRAIILVIAGLTLLLLIRGVPRPRGWPRLSLHPRVVPVVLTVAVLSLYAISFERLGAFTLMPLFCVAISRAFTRRPLLPLLAYGIAVTVVTWALFVLLLGAPLPGSRLPIL